MLSLATLLLCLKHRICSRHNSGSRGRNAGSGYSGGRPPAAAVQEDAEALDLDRVLELQADTIEAQQRAAAGLAAQVLAAAVQQLAECRQLWPGGVDTAARLEAAIKVLGGMPPAPPRDSLYALGQRDRRAAVLRFCGRG